MANAAFKEENFKVKSKRQKTQSNRFLYGFVTVFIVGYIIFFTSSLWLPKTYEGVPITPVGETVSQNDRNVTIDRWIYSPSQKLLEIIVEVENNSIDDITEYEWQVRDKNGFLKTEVIDTDGIFTVIFVSGVKKDWTEVSLTMSAKIPEKEDGEVDVEENVSFVPIVIYTNDKVTPTTDNIEPESMAKYKKYAYESKIESFENMVSDIEKDITDIEASIKNANERIKDLEGRLKNQTETEQEDTRSLITNLSSQIEQMEKEIEDKEKEKEELLEKIELQKVTLSELEN